MQGNEDDQGSCLYCCLVVCDTKVNLPQPLYLQLAATRMTSQCFSVIHLSPNESYVVVFYFQLLPVSLKPQVPVSISCIPSRL